MKNFIVTFILSSFLLIGCDLINGDDFKSTDKGTLKISLDNVAGSQDLVLSTGNYTNASNESFNVTTLKYFISNIKLTNENGTEYVYPQDNSYFLVDESKPESLTLNLTDVPAGNYTGITYTIGVDSLRNTMDVTKRTGNLDIAGTAQGMYWAWNSGYIFFKMEGTSPQIATSNYRYHIGLYGGLSTKTVNNVKKNTLAFGSETLKVRKDKNPQINLKMDVLKVFTGNNNLKLVDNPVIMVSPLSVNVSANYVNAFSFSSITADVK